MEWGFSLKKDLILPYKKSNMLKSMTGFGKATGTYKGKKITIEIRALNSKTIDLNLRLPSLYRELDPVFRKKITEELKRGKIDCSVKIDMISEEDLSIINKNLAKAYYKELKEINQSIQEESQDYLSMILRMPDIYMTGEEELSGEEKKVVLNILEEALENLNAFRKKEGEDLEKEFHLRIAYIRKLLSEIPKYEKERIEVIKERMKKALEEMSFEKYDENRLEQEMIFYIEKLDISEEKMRLANHLDYFEQTMEGEETGKKLGFISQEIGREVNTLGSKSNHAEMQKIVINMKDNLEKIKEQILNTL